jgi:hypothetical protein
MSATEATLRACRHYLRKNATGQQKLIKRIDDAILSLEPDKNKHRREAEAIRATLNLLLIP